MRVCKDCLRVPYEHTLQYYEKEALPDKSVPDIFYFALFRLLRLHRDSGFEGPSNLAQGSKQVNILFFQRFVTLYVWKIENNFAPTRPGRYFRRMGGTFVQVETMMGHNSTKTYFNHKMLLNIDV